MRDVNVGWGEKRVLCHLNWTVLPGEHWLIRGPNGAGKTTLLELITGDNMQVFSNDVSIFGKRRGSGETLWDIRSRLGIVSHRLHLEYRRVGDTPLEAVLISGFYDSIGLYEVPGDREKAAAKQWLALAGLDARRNEPFKALSYGEQRVALILRGAVKSPPLLILDEPCHGLDTEGRSLVLDLMDTVAALGASTLLHVTHDPTEVRPFEKHVLEMKIED
jgi:molybdate transport system ATP-binding protein